MHFVIAPASMKGALSASDVALAMARGVRRRRANVTIDLMPLGDGGEGTVEALAHRSPLTTRRHRDLRGTPRDVPVVVIDENFAVIECASLVGHTLVDDAVRDPRRDSTAPLAELVLALCDAGFTTVGIGIGGTATVDGGVGMLMGLGAIVNDARGTLVPLTDAGRRDEVVSFVDVKPAKDALRGVSLIGVVDVNATLVGDDGMRQYMPQKGATGALALALERGICTFYDVAGRPDIASTSGAGAGGGLGAAVLALGGTLVMGSEFVFRHVDAGARIDAADVIFTGEGQYDPQTRQGKVVSAVCARAAQRNTPVVALVGSRWPSLRDAPSPEPRVHASSAAASINDAAVPTSVFSIASGPLAAFAMMDPENAARLVEDAAFEVAGLLVPP